MINKIQISSFLNLVPTSVVIDVRSPAEYQHAHIPHATNIPLFSNDERKIVGTLYKQQSREAAIKAGLDMFGGKMRQMVEQVEALVPDKKTNVLVHCWRGGMRSAAVAWLLDLYGFKVATLIGGYKQFRRWALQQLEQPYRFNVLGGYTGSGKTEVLTVLAKRGELVIDLEAIACHKGSAFGGFSATQPSQEMFENLLAYRLFQLSIASPEGKIWVEDECRRIGHINLPLPIWNCLRSAPIYFLEVPFGARLQHIIAGYGTATTEELINATIRISKRLGGLNTKNAINHLLEKNVKDCFSILLKYYDKQYEKGLYQREQAEKLLHPIAASNTDARANAALLLNAALSGT
jgi:tRNA 2-selenouridine synthase